MSEARLHFGGLPTEIDVKKLIDHFGVPASGTLLAHEDIAACIGSEWKSVRYRTVVHVWRRKLLKEHNVDTEFEMGRGLKILYPNERLDASESDFRSSTRKLRKAAVRVSLIDTATLDDPIARKRKDHLQAVTARVFMTAANECKALKPPPPPQALPRRMAPAGSQVLGL